MINDLKYWLLLQSIEGIGPVTYKLLLDKFSEPERVFDATVVELQTIPRFNQKIIDQIIQAKQKLNEIDVVLGQLRNHNVSAITINETSYPEMLKKLSNPPPIVYLMKQIPQGKTVGIIGTRDASQLGKEKAAEFANELAKSGYVIVSGYAKGIDISAHCGAISNDGKTIAVLPTGILKFSVDEELSKTSNKFLNQATVLSEFYPLSEWSVGNALSRNRITAILSDSILVIESGDSGGTINTVEHATKHGKKVFLYRGIQSSMDEKIINLGAIQINKVNELLALLDT